MERLTDEQLTKRCEVLPFGQRLWYRQIRRIVEDDDCEASDVELSWWGLAEDLIKALTPQSCGHPRGCIVSVPYIGEMKSNSCGWCVAAVTAEQRLERLGESSKRISDLDACLHSAQKERDALREKLAVVEPRLEECLEQIRILTRQRNAYRAIQGGNDE